MKATHPLAMIVAMSENRVIGHHNKLPWHLPADLKHFKTLTTGHVILMGRKTYESIGRPLPDRDNIILTRNAYYEAPGCLVITSKEEALEKAAQQGDKTIFIIGGSEIFQQLLSLTQRIYLTIVHTECEGDAFFPELDLNEWREISRIKHEADEKNQYAYSFLVLEKK